MSIKNKYQAYQNNAVNTASSGKLTLMLYNGCIKFIRQAIRDVNENNYESRNTNIQKAQNIIQELMITLDHENEISKQMLSLYEYTNFQLQEANIKNDVKYLEEALGFIVEFRDTWEQVLIRAGTEQYTESTQV